MWFFNSHQPVLLVAPSTCIQPAAKRPSCQAISRFPSLWAFCTHRTGHRNHLGTTNGRKLGCKINNPKNLFLWQDPKPELIILERMDWTIDYILYIIYIYIYVCTESAASVLELIKIKSSAWSIATQIANFVGSGKNSASIQVTFALLWLFNVCQFVVLTFRCYCLQRSTHYLTWVLVQRAFPQYRLGIHVPDQTP